jgi:hypothetical protein
MRVAVLEALRRVTLVPIGCDLPFVAAIQAGELSLIVSVAIGHSGRG